MRAVINKIKSHFDGLPIAVPVAASVLLCLFQNFAPSSLPPLPKAASGIARMEQSLFDDHYSLRTDLDRDLAAVVALRPTVFVMPLNLAFAMTSPRDMRTEARAELTQIATTLQNEGVRVEFLTDLFPVWLTGASAADGGAVPCPSVHGAYERFLRNYEETFVTLTAALPTDIVWADEPSVNRWQTLFPIQVGYGSCGEISFSPAERKQIGADLAARRLITSKHVADSNP